MKKGDMRLISVIMGEPTSDQRNYDTVKLLNFGFSQYQLVPYKSDNFVIGQYQNYLFTPQKVNIVTTDPINFVTKKGEQLTGITEQYTFTIDKNKIIPGEQIGELKLIKDGKVVYTVPLTVEQTIQKASFFEVLGRTLKSMFFG